MFARLSNRKDNRECPLGRPRHRFLGLLSQESQIDTHNTSSKGFSMWELIEMLSLRELIRDATSEVLWRGPVTQAASAWHRRQFVTPWRKAGVQHKPYCLHSWGKASLLSSRAGRNPSKIQVPRHQPRQPCKQACRVEEFGSTLLISFCMHAITRKLVASTKGFSLSCYLGRVDRCSTTELCFQPPFDFFFPSSGPFFNLYSN